MPVNPVQSLEVDAVDSDGEPSVYRCLTRQVSIESGGVLAFAPCNAAGTPSGSLIMLAPGYWRSATANPPGEGL